ncbi:amidohydrolase [Pseudogracilibacillus auburnensis]|uniref:amidohydrolase n=1 Tax=Pseudogracilibacillus auburnensis TaxID=1494959 RepID=UPI001A9568F7|nr:amidohydrolase [Pseudogracilibacillus auburnensis]MBO1004340.1 amidohydrolase [Pseudogracilibacillus auburnensis]
MTADIIYYNGEIHTFDHDEKIFEAIAIKNGKISALGSNKLIQSQQESNTRMVNLKNQTVLPGFIDAHLHIFPLGVSLSHINCQMDSIEQVVKAVEKEAANCKNEDEWVIGWGFDESNYKENRKPTKWDFAHINNPVYITRYCLHEAVCNERVLKKAGVTSSTMIDNGMIERNEHGEATGLLIESAMTFAEAILPVNTEESMKSAVKLANDYIVSRGITSIHDAGLGFFEDPYKEFKVLDDVIRNRELKVRMYVMILAEYYKALMKKYSSVASEKLKIGAMKLFADGTLSGRNAALSVPYKGSDEQGLFVYTHAKLQEQMEFVFETNYPVAVHAIGDAAIAQVLDVYEALNNLYPERTARNRIEHTTITNNVLLNRMKQLGVTAIPQPEFLYSAGDKHMNVIEKETGKYIALKSFFDYDLHPAGSSDGPVADCNPLFGMSAAMKRQTKGGTVIYEEEKISLKEAVRMYTINAAYAAEEEHFKGSIEIGKVADLTVLPEGFMTYTADEVKGANVRMTIIEGEIVYQST